MVGAAFGVIVSGAVPFTATQALALPDGAVCGTVSTYDWGTQPGGSTPAAYTMNGVQVTPSLVRASGPYNISTSTQGNESGYIYMDLDGRPDGQRTEVDLLFSEALYDVEFTLLDVDYARRSWTDIVQVRAYDGAADVSSMMTGTTVGPAAVQTGTNPLTFQGVASSAPPSTDGNVILTIPGPVTRININYIDGSGDNLQILGIGDLTFCSPQIGLAKNIVSGPTHNGDGTYDTTFRFVVDNLGGTTLHDVQVVDDLAASFGNYVSGAPDAPGEYTIGTPSFVTNSANALGFDGSFRGSGGNTTILDPAVGSLAPGEQVVFDVPVSFYPDLAGGPDTFTNTATAQGDTALSDNGVTSGDTTDISDDGVDPDPNGNGDPGEAGENDPTSFTITAAPAVTLDKRSTGHSDMDGSGTTNAGDEIAPWPPCGTSMRGASRESCHHRSRG